MGFRLRRSQASFECPPVGREIEDVGGRQRQQDPEWWVWAARRQPKVADLVSFNSSVAFYKPTT